MRILIALLLSGCAYTPTIHKTLDERYKMAKEYCGKPPYAFDLEGIQCELPGELKSPHP